LYLPLGEWHIPDILHRRSYIVSKPIITLALCLLAVLTSGCAQYENKRGVEVTWQDSVTRHLEPGKTSRQEVLRLLGPPSQVISLGEETVLYYLFERSEGEGLILILYNRMKIDTRYDRAILFFDENDVLTDFSTRTDVADGD
jgi:outer membrane protein assembly factor BamE (lipoprotein component of BamABCDE complex)